MEENKEVKVSEAEANKEEKPSNVKKDGKFEKKGNFNPKKGKRLNKPENKEFEEKIVDINRISKTVQGGRRMRFSALAVVGDKKGHYGFGLMKAQEVPDAMKKATEAARKNLRTVDIIMPNKTIAHEVMGKFGATKVFLKPAPAGTGIIAGGPVRAILELCGLRNVVSKVYGARSSINVIRATDNAIASLKNKKKVYELRGLNKGE